MDVEPPSVAMLDEVKELKPMIYQTIKQVVSNFKAFITIEGELMVEQQWANGVETTQAFADLPVGLRYVLGMVTDMALRCVSLNSYLGENSILETTGFVLIDGIDLNLHPKWQKVIVSDLKTAFPNIQFIATTHSPFIVQSLAAYEIINLDGQVLAANPKDRSLEESVLYMGVESSKSEDFEGRKRGAERFFNVLEEGLKSMGTRGAGGVDDLNKELDDILEEFSDDPAFVAKLRIEKISKLGR